MTSESLRSGLIQTQTGCSQTCLVPATGRTRPWRSCGRRPRRWPRGRRRRRLRRRQASNAPPRCADALRAPTAPAPTWPARQTAAQRTRLA
eukprot:6202398-Pleurochrysis_carterae.AAC.5